MKLVTKTTLYFLVAIIPLLALGGYLLFYQFSNEINKRVDREMVSEEVQWIRYLQSVTADGRVFILKSPDLLIQPTDLTPKRFPAISTTYTKSEGEGNREYRQLEHVVSINGLFYQLLIRKSQEQKAVLVANVTSIMLLVFTGIVLLLLLFNWIINKKLWQPFTTTLQKIRSIELSKMKAVQFEPTNTTEFNELNASLNGMTQKLYNDFITIKEFTENAAHEMQTPLAIAQTKMELLLQDPHLTESGAASILQASEALSRLGKLNQSLLLLAKIENNQFKTDSSIALGMVARKYLTLYEELIADKQLRADLTITEEFVVQMHPFLADSLVSNLLGNAIKYNVKRGDLLVTITANKFCVSNTSHLPVIPYQQLFQRFAGNSHPNESSTGLGLSIVKKIADSHQLSVSYGMGEQTHKFCLHKVE